MLIRINKFLSSDQISLNINEKFIFEDEDFLVKTHLYREIDFNGSIFKVDENVILNGTIKYNFADECARCLMPFDNTVTTGFDALLLRHLDEDDLSDEIRLKITDGCVDLEEIIKQMIYLSMPMKSLCKKDCEGICPNCGVNLNIEKCKCNEKSTDPRFDKLKEMLKD